MPDLNEQYERYLRQHIDKLSRKVLNLYYSAIQEVLVGIDKVKYNGREFRVTDYPQLQRRIDYVLKGLNKSVYSVILNGIDGAWALANKKNDIIVDRRVGKRSPTPVVKRILYDANKEALTRFSSRKEKGLGLSDRVWNSIQPFRDELEANLGSGIMDGKSAKAIAADARKNLLNPDKLFRRVRDENGKLKLSRAAQAYNPGQGTYRSSYKNANRLTRTENNMAYRSADYERWQNMPFVIGIEVKLSNAHPRYDICDHLKGDYPKDFKFVGWHPQCICFQIPKMMNEADYSRYEDSILGIADFDPSTVRKVTGPPASFTKYFEDNERRINGWKNKPYWVKDNASYLSK